MTHDFIVRARRACRAPIVAVYPLLTQAIPRKLAPETQSLSQRL